MAKISLNNLRKSFGNTDVIHGIDMDIADSELVVIVGPSGCGKSTLLRMVAGLEEVTEGTISINDKVVNNVEPKDRDIAMVFQTYALYPHMSVFNNMAYGLKIAKLPREEIRSRVENAAKILALDELLHRKPRELSGGQRQRVAMGRAIVRKPSVFLFDEPLSNLDALLRVQMRLEIKQLQRQLGVTSLYVTHDQVEAMTLADRLIVMNQGYAEQIDTPMAIYRRPASVFVAGFIGSPGMNFLPARLDPDNRNLLLPGGDSLVSPRINPAEALELKVGLRPEHILPASKEDAQLALKVDALETLGADTLAHGELTHRRSDTGMSDESGERCRLTVRLDGSADVSEQAILYLKVHPQYIHLFNAQTGLRVE